MGVPHFFNQLLKSYKKDGFVFKKEKIDNKDIKDIIDSIDYFLLDANSFIHPVCFKVVADNPDVQNNDRLEDKIMVAIIEYLEKLIEYVDPKKGIFLAIDGVAPVAKIKQQRSRRFKSVADRMMMDSIKRKHKKPTSFFWNNSAITPGTVFMEKLDKYIQAWVKRQKLHVIYSSCFEPGEGEHKLLDFIRENTQKGNKYSYVIYGLDADLIFLALSTQLENIFLLRESTEMNSKEEKGLLSYVSISVMRSCIISTMKKAIYEKSNGINMELNEEALISDYIFMCYFLGNDFLPHIPSLEIQNDGITHLIEKYAETLYEILLERNKVESLLGKNHSVSQDFFARFINKLAIQEIKTLKLKYTEKKYRVKCDGDEYEKEVCRIENLQFKVEDPIELGSDDYEKYRFRYYNHYWNVEEDELEEFAEKLVHHYLLGLKWVTQYYFEGCPSWSWYLPFDHPPFINDINKFMQSNMHSNQSNQFDQMQFNKGKPIKPLMQLLAVLPPQSSNLLPSHLSKLMTNPKSSLAFLYPVKFEQDFVNKRKYWMAIPNLPPLDMDLLKHYFEKYNNS